jgi:hypothetical protein
VIQKIADDCDPRVGSADLAKIRLVQTVVGLLLTFSVSRVGVIN